MFFIFAAEKTTMFDKMEENLLRYGYSQSVVTMACSSEGAVVVMEAANVSEEEIQKLQQNEAIDVNKMAKIAKCFSWFAAGLKEFSEDGTFKDFQKDAVIMRCLAQACPLAGAKEEMIMKIDMVLAYLMAKKD